jgi:hypothetical protein
LKFEVPTALKTNLLLRRTTVQKHNLLPAIAAVFSSVRSRPELGTRRQYSRRRPGDNNPNGVRATARRQRRAAASLPAPEHHLRMLAALRSNENKRAAAAAASAA